MAKQLMCAFDVFMSLVCPISMPAALRQPQNKLARGFLKHVSCVCLPILLTFQFGVTKQRACGASATSEQAPSGILEQLSCLWC